MGQEQTHHAEGVDEVTGQAHEAIESVHEQTRAIAGNLRELARDTGEKLKGTASTAGKTLERAASSVRDGLPREGMVGAAAGSVADFLESAGESLERQELPKIGKTLEDLLRRRPFAALLMSVGAGYLFARATRR